MLSYLLSQGSVCKFILKCKKFIGLDPDLWLYLFLGHERFGGMTKVYYKYAHGALIVFDLSR
jgi:signal recognition particle receptor subunit beta